MPPAISDHDEASDAENNATAPPPKKVGRQKKAPVVYKEEFPDIDDEDDVATKDTTNGDAEEDDEEGGEDDEEPEEYVVEKIISHMIDDKGIPLFEVKWEGYEKKSDRTWEPEENLRENASIVLDEYFSNIGGRDKIFEAVNALSKKKRGRPLTGGTPTANGKRTKKLTDHPADSDAPLSARAAAWKPPAGSWEDHIAQLDACEDEDTHKLMVYLTWKNGHKTQHETSVIYNRCPQKMLQFYEKHVKIVKREADADSLAGSDAL